MRERGDDARRVAAGGAPGPGSAESASAVGESTVPVAVGFSGPSALTASSCTMADRHAADAREREYNHCAVLAPTPISAAPARSSRVSTSRRKPAQSSSESVLSGVMSTTPATRWACADAGPNSGGVATVAERRTAAVPDPAASATKDWRDRARAPVCSWAATAACRAPAVRAGKSACSRTTPAISGWRCTSSR